MSISDGRVIYEPMGNYNKPLPFEDKTKLDKLIAGSQVQRLVNSMSGSAVSIKMILIIAAILLVVFVGWQLMKPKNIEENNNQNTQENTLLVDKIDEVQNY